jgi:ribosome maturation factor RimP
MVSQIEVDVQTVIERIALAQGVEFYWLDMKRSGPRWHVTVYIDRAGGVSIADCERVSRALEEPLDALIERSYDLEVSSPGMDRPLHTPAHYERALGKPVEVRLRSPREGRKVLTGWLHGIANNELFLEVAPGETVQVSLHDVHHAQVIESRFL